MGGGMKGVSPTFLHISAPGQIGGRTEQLRSERKLSDGPVHLTRLAPVCNHEARRHGVVCPRGFCSREAALSTLCRSRYLAPPAGRTSWARRRVEHPDPGAKAPSPPTAPPQATSESSAHAPSPSDVDTQSSGFTLSPSDKAIRGDKPARPWSKNVPKRSCTKDDECGEGSCDRGRCAAIWTWNLTLGQRCERNGLAAWVALATLAAISPASTRARISATSRSGLVS